MTNVCARRHHLAVFGALVTALSGCAAMGFDPLDDSINPLPQAADGGGGAGGVAGTVSGQGGGSGGASGQAGFSGGGQGGQAAQGGRAGSAGNMIFPADASVPMPDAGPGVVTVCNGKLDGSPCDDGKYCTIEDFCLNQRCESIEDLDCDKDCNQGTCDETQDQCMLTPLPDGTACGSPVKAECINGICPSPTITCTNGGECSPECTSPICTYDCHNANSCRPLCEDGSICNTDCVGTAECALTCNDAVCTMDCRESGTCDVDCSGETAVCTVMCTDASGCEGNECLDGATCALICDEPDGCKFDTCWGAEQQCEDGTVLCNDECD